MDVIQNGGRDCGNPRGISIVKIVSSKISTWVYHPLHATWL